ncbi:DUF3253 domain-containing protein [Ancylobacter sp. 6x-1]|uniref:DUF3253 domain-containing protein n=1 Tax=Ancylobacter crimeensis TaxID=2579147 RepID=A0ABT0DC79_9HYPH|nr:DUF3253 domain-containing protein [Ancylobacter crimeensis]MCK0197571.1 DUF3253 domain-containing protein [Ancylobacter crimeensis]
MTDAADMTDAARTRADTATDAAENDAARIILALIAAAPKGRSIDPADAAREIGAKAGDAAAQGAGTPAGDHWQRHLPLVRRAAVRLAGEGRIAIYRKGKPVDPSGFRGVYRLGKPAETGEG